MKEGCGISVCDLANWLPPYGESAVSIDCKRQYLIIGITYKSAETLLEPDLKLNLKFPHVSAFYKSIYPGVKILNVDYDYPLSASGGGSLIEYPDSEAALAWRQYYQGCFGRESKIKHYKIVFLATNTVIEVFNKQFELEGPLNIADTQYGVIS